MKILRLYIRVLALLGPEARLGWALAIASVSLASAQFIEPVLFGRIVDNLANAQSGTRSVSWSDLLPLVGAWVGFGLFIIVAGTMVALHADRLAHSTQPETASPSYRRAQHVQWTDLCPHHRATATSDGRTHR